MLLYKDWLDTFKRDVEAQIEQLRKAPAAASPADVRPLQEALEGLREWWDRAYEDPAGPGESLISVQINRELHLSRQEVAALRAELDRLRADKDMPIGESAERLREAAEERARLEQQLAAAQREVAGLKHLRELKGELDQELGGLRLRMSAIRGEYEARLKVDRERIESLERRAAAMEADLKGERERRAAAEKALEDGRKRLAEAESVRTELRAIRGELNTRLETAAEFLEAKIRGVQDQSKGQGQQLRDLVDALRRMREV